MIISPELDEQLRGILTLRQQWGRPDDDWDGMMALVPYLPSNFVAMNIRSSLVALRRAEVQRSVAIADGVQTALLDGAL